MKTQRNQASKTKTNQRKLITIGYENASNVLGLVRTGIEQLDYPIYDNNYVKLTTLAWNSKVIKVLNIIYQMCSLKSVSYTHLTLPTICSV